MGVGAAVGMCENEADLVFVLGTRVRASKALPGASIFLLEQETESRHISAAAADAPRFIIFNDTLLEYFIMLRFWHPAIADHYVRNY